MIPKTIYKLKNQSKNTSDLPPVPRCSTDYKQPPGSVAIRNKLTKGCKKYEQLKDAYTRPADNHVKTDYNEYTFEPRLSSKGKNSRSFKKFLEDQENFQHNRDNKIREFKTEMTKAEFTECTNRPSIDKVSKRICTLMNYEKEQVVERLYKKKALEQYKDDEQLFSPKINARSKSLRRTQNISDLLHSDALRRKQKKQVQQIEKEMPVPASPSILRNTYQLVCNKMYTQFCELAPEEETTIALVVAWTIISEIFGIELNPNRQGREGKICENMMKYLCQDGQQTVTRDRLWEFIEIIVKKNEVKSKFFGQELSQIIEQFGNLYTCRIARPRSQREPEQYSFIPETLRSSELKAQKHREKILQSAKQFIENQKSKINLNEEITIQDIFSIDHMMRKASQEKRKISREKQIMKQCTFKPKLSDNYKKPVYMPPRVTSNSKIVSSKRTLIKSISSQSISMSQSFMAQSLKNTQLKFHLQEQDTNMKPKKKKQNTKISCSSVKNIEKSLLRMAIARKDRQLSNQIKNRGYPKNIQNWTSYTQQEKNEIASQHRKLKGFTYKKVSLR